MAVKAGEIVIEINAKTTKFKKGMKDAEKSAMSFKKIAETAIGFGVAQAGAMAASAIKNFVVESTKAAIDFEQRFSSFTRLVEGDANRLMSNLQLAAQGTVSQLGIVSAANQALMLGISQQQLPEMMRAASVMGAAMGRTTEQAFADLAMGIGRQSRMILDNLGIIVKVSEANQAYADSLNINVDALNTQQQRMAFNIAVTDAMRSSVEKLEGSLTEASKASMEFQTTWKDFSVEVGTPIQKVLTLWTRGFLDIQDILSNIEKRVPGGRRRSLLEVLFGTQEMPTVYTEEPEFMRAEREAKSKELTESDTRRFEIATENAQAIIDNEKKIQDLMVEGWQLEESSVLEIEGLRALNRQKDLDGVAAIGLAWADFFAGIRGEITGIRELTPEMFAAMKGADVLGAGAAARYPLSRGEMFVGGTGWGGIYPDVMG